MLDRMISIPVMHPGKEIQETYLPGATNPQGGKNRPKSCHCDNVKLLSYPGTIYNSWPVPSQVCLTLIYSFFLLFFKLLSSLVHLLPSAQLHMHVKQSVLVAGVFHTCQENRFGGPSLATISVSFRMS
jgi:hypothetical protein